jgi:hypothetical protein
MEKSLTFSTTRPRSCGPENERDLSRFIVSSNVTGANFATERCCIWI